jgi:hypothetical protein
MLMKPIVTFTPNIHSQITEEANNGYLNPEELSHVILGNILQDLYQTVSAIHFDNCAFKQGQEYIMDQWGLIEAIGNKTDQQSLFYFGQLLHTVQDFYSHSNWVELHETNGDLPIWDLDINDLPPGIVSGTFILGSPKCCPKGAPTHKELNKDKPGSEEGKKVVQEGPNKGMTLYELAFKSAVKATKVQFEKYKVLDRPKTVDLDVTDSYNYAEEILSTLVEALDNIK